MILVHIKTRLDLLGIQTFRWDQRLGRQYSNFNESFNDWGVRGCHRFIPVLGVVGTKIAPPGDLFDQLPLEMSSIRGKLANHVGDRVVLSPERVVSMTSPGTESSYPPPPDR